MNHQEHPIGQHFAAVACGQRPTDADLDELVDRCIDSQSEGELSPEQLRRELARWQRQILAAHADGNSGQARQYAREGTAVLATSLGDLPPVNKSAGKSVRDVIDSIPR